MKADTIANLLSTHQILKSVVWDNLAIRQQRLLETLLRNSILILATEHHINSDTRTPDLLFKLTTRHLSRFLRSFIDSGYAQENSLSISWIKNLYKELLRLFPANIPKNHLWLEADSVLGNFLSFFISSNARYAHFNQSSIIDKSLELLENHSRLRLQSIYPDKVSECILKLMTRIGYTLTEIGFMSRDDASHLKLLFSPSIDQLSARSARSSSLSALDEYETLVSAFSDTDLPILVLYNTSIRSIISELPIDHYNVSLSLYPDLIKVDLEIFPPEFTFSIGAEQRILLIDRFWQNLNSFTASNLISFLYSQKWLDNAAHRIQGGKPPLLYPHHFKISLSRTLAVNNMKIYQKVQL